MESPYQNCTGDENSLGKREFAFLTLVCLLLFGFSLVQPRILSTHEAVHCLNVREMFASGEFLIPTYGGMPWLERPPVPHWLTGIFAAMLGDFQHEWVMRLGSILIATSAVLVFSWAIAGCLGRTLGVMSGAILATTREFSAYAVGPEADIFLASTITIISSLFLRLQFRTAATEQPGSFFGKRSALTVLFFLLLGLTNWMKGPLFGMIFVLMPMSGYLIWQKRLGSMRRFVWFWGWLLTLVVGATWPVIALVRYPDILEMWLVDYGIRWKSGYLGEPFWYYFVNQPWNLFPWSIAFIIGLFATARSVFRGESSPLRFIWCWALLPLLFFSLFKGKHHHYMTNCMAPAAALCAIGTLMVWRQVPNWPSVLQKPWLPLAILGVPGVVLILIFGGKIPGPDWLRWVLAVGYPVVLTTMWWTGCHRNGRFAFASSCAIIMAVNSFFYYHRSCYLDNYEGDQGFIHEVKAKATADQPMFVVRDIHPLTSSWLLYYLGDRTHLLHNVTFLRDDRITAPVAYIVCRYKEEPALAEYGVAVRLAQASQTRGESSPGDRWTLYQFRYHPHLARMSANVHISAMQATGRAFGPYLGRAVAAGEASSRPQRATP